MQLLSCTREQLCVLCILDQDRMDIAKRLLQEIISNRGSAPIEVDLDVYIISKTQQQYNDSLDLLSMIQGYHRLHKTVIAEDINC